MERNCATKDLLKGLDLGALSVSWSDLDGKILGIELNL